MSTEWEVITGDCLEVMRGMDAGSVDAVVTDPPYSSGGFTETAKRQAKGQGLRSETLRDVGWFINDNMGSAGAVWLMRSVAVESARLLKSGGSLCVFTDWRMVSHLLPAMESSGLRAQNLIVWDKGSPGLGVGFRPQHELILHFVKGVGIFHTLDGRNVISSKRIHSLERKHQTEKPTRLMAELIRVVSPPHGVVLDPFTGSGSTGCAAVNLLRRFIGIEIDPGYTDIARARIAKAAEQARQMELL